MSAARPFHKHGAYLAAPLGGAAELPTAQVDADPSGSEDRSVGELAANWAPEAS